MQKKKCRYFRQKQRNCLLLHNIQHHSFQQNLMNEQNRERILQIRSVVAHIAGIITAMTSAISDVYAVFILKTLTIYPVDVQHCDCSYLKTKKIFLRIQLVKHNVRLKSTDQRLICQV